MKLRQRVDGDWRIALTWFAVLLAIGGNWGAKIVAQDAAFLPACRLPVLDNDTAWQRLPKTVAEPVDRRLPIWARALVGPLPQTTAAMLELDHLYRTSEAIEPRLRGAMRWTAARANHCDLGQQYAEADLLRAGMTRDEVDGLEATIAAWPAKERAAIAFARKLTLSASTISDDEVAELVAAFGEPAVVAIVLQTAYANFQDRLLLALGVAVEPEGPLPPLAVRFVAPGRDDKIAATRPKLEPAAAASSLKDVGPGAEWAAVPFDQLVRAMQAQRALPGRVSVPMWQDVHPRLPAESYRADRPVRIKWSLVVLGHQPKMGVAWHKCLRTFAREADQDRVLEESLFWVITRTIDCFY